jgi:hypothetical protein
VVILLISLIPGIALAGSVANLSESDDTSVGPSVAASNGHVHAVWAEATPDDLFYSHSSDSGNTWGRKQLTTMEGGAAYSPAIAANGSNVHVAFTYLGAPTGTAIWYMRSTNYGMTWSSPRLMAADVDYYTQADIAVDGPNVHITWHTGASEADIYTVGSRNSGKTWSLVRNLTNNTRYELSPTVEVIGTGKDAVVLVVWYSYNEDVHFRRSTNNGKSWSKTRRVAKTKGQSYAPDVAAGGGRVYVTWADQTKTPGVGEIFFASSEDGGATWQRWKRLSATVDPSYPPTVSASGNMVDVAWAEGGSSQEVYIRRSRDSGNSWTAMKRVSPRPFDSSRPDLATANGKTHVVWEDDTFGEFHTEVYYRRFGG